jgi:ribosomal protein S18 acetylase RimI-like enzyme
MITGSTLQIRKYRREDHDAVVRLNAYGLAAAGVPVDADVYAGDMDNIVTTYLTGRATLLVGEVASAVIAMGALHPVNARTCEITRMRVAPSMQGRGIGRAMLTALEQTARELGYREAVLLTGPEQHPAIDLYRAAGYTVTATERHGPLIGVRMHKHVG